MPSRGERSEADLAEINSEIPEAVSLEKRALDLNPDKVAMLFGPRSDRDKAAACLQDVAAFLTEARYALFEARAHWIWHTKDSPREPNIAGLFWAQYYLDDAVLRMYSTGEHAAGFIGCYFGIGRDAIRTASGKTKGRGASRLAGLGWYGRSVERAEPILERLVALLDDASWAFVSEYRNKWVHEQRPRLQGLGDTYARRTRWKKAKHRLSDLNVLGTSVSEGQRDVTTYMLGLGSGDPPDLTIDVFFEKTTHAYALLRDLVEGCCEEFEAEVAQRQSQSLSISSKEY